jgi:hypothetical protein
MIFTGGTAMLSLRRIEFDNGAVVFLQPKDHDRQIGCLLSQVLREKLVIQDMTIEKAAAWNIAVHLFHMPTGYYVH